MKGSLFVNSRLARNGFPVICNSLLASLTFQKKILVTHALDSSTNYGLNKGDCGAIKLIGFVIIRYECFTGKYTTC